MSANSSASGAGTPSAAESGPEYDSRAGTLPIAYTIVRSDGLQEVNAEIIHEKLVSFFVNGQELATLMCTPCDLEALALGFLSNEGVIGGLEDVRAVHVCPSGSCGDIWLRRADF